MRAITTATTRSIMSRREGDNELMRCLVSKGADVQAVSRRGQTTADRANGPCQRTSPYTETIALLEKLGSKNNHNCVGC